MKNINTVFNFLFQHNNFYAYENDKWIERLESLIYPEILYVHGFVETYAEQHNLYYIYIVDKINEKKSNSTYRLAICFDKSKKLIFRSIKNYFFHQGSDTRIRNEKLFLYGQPFRLKYQVDREPTIEFHNGFTMPK